MWGVAVPPGDERVGSRSAVALTPVRTTSEPWASQASAPPANARFARQVADPFRARGLRARCEADLVCGELRVRIVRECPAVSST